MLLAFEFSAGLIAFTTELFDRGVGGVELFPKLADRLPGSGEFVAVIERFDECRWLLDAGLAGAVGADAVSITAPFAWPAALAGDRHRTDCNATRRNGQHLGARVWREE